MSDECHPHPYDSSYDGRAWIEEMRGHRERLISEGVTDPTKLHFAVADAYVEAHRGQETYREYQARVLNPRWEAASAARRKVEGASVMFTPAELALLAEHFDGANDPIAVSILEKVRAALA